MQRQLPKGTSNIVILHVIEGIPPCAEIYTGMTFEMERKQQEATVEGLAFPGSGRQTGQFPKSP